MLSLRLLEDEIRKEIPWHTFLWWNFSAVCWCHSVFCTYRLQFSLLYSSIAHILRNIPYCNNKTWVHPRNRPLTCFWRRTAAFSSVCCEPLLHVGEDAPVSFFVLMKSTNTWGFKFVWTQFVPFTMFSVYSQPTLINVTPPTSTKIGRNVNVSY